MTTFPNSPKLLKGGLVLVSLDSGVVQRIIVLQYNRENGILQLAVRETILYPDSGRLIANNNLAGVGTLEIAPIESSLTLFVWSPCSPRMG